MRCVVRASYALLSMLLLGWPALPVGATPDDDAAVLGAIFPGGVPALPYTLYPYHGPVDHSAHILARVPDGADQLVAVAVVSAPRAAGYDAQGRVGVALLARAAPGWRVLAESGFSARATYAGTVSNAQVLRDYPAAGDRSLRYTYTLSGSGAARTTYLRVYHRAGRALWEALAVQIDQEVAAGSCCASGETASVRAVLLAAGPPAYAVQFAGYARRGTRTDTYIAPGAVVYSAHGGAYRSEQLQLPSGPLALARLPVLAALAGAGLSVWPTDAAHAYLPGALAALHEGSSIVVGARLAATWDATGLHLLVLDGPGWPGGALPSRLDLYLQPYGARSPTHHILSGKEARCVATATFPGPGFTCVIGIPGPTASGRTLPASPGPYPGNGSVHRYHVIAATRLGLALTAPGGAQQRYALDPDTTASQAGRLSTLLFLAPG